MGFLRLDFWIRLVFGWVWWRQSSIRLGSGQGQGTKTDEFLEKFETAFNPPLIFGKYIANLL